VKDGLGSSWASCVYVHSERSDDTVPTVGFTTDQVQIDDNVITLYDVGGGARIRDIWRNYFADVHGLVYVVDSSDPQRMEESRTALEAVFKDPIISGKPCLVWDTCSFIHSFAQSVQKQQ